MRLSTCVYQRRHRGHLPVRRPRTSAPLHVLLDEPEVPLQQAQRAPDALDSLHSVHRVSLHGSHQSAESPLKCSVRKLRTPDVLVHPPSGWQCPAGAGNQTQDLTCNVKPH